MTGLEFEVGKRDVMDLTTVDRYAICERDTRRVVVWNRASGTSYEMTYKLERNAQRGLGRAAAVLRNTALMVVDREAE